MSTTPPDQPYAQGGGATPPPPPPSFEKQSQAGASTPPAYGGAPAGGYNPPPAYGNPPAGGYGSTGGYGAPPAPGYGGAPGYPAGVVPLSDSDQRMWATLAHIGPVLLGFVAPLVIWLVFKDRGRFVEEQAKESLNFQITLTIAAVAVFIISIVTLGLGSILYIAFIVALVFMIMAAVAANKGEAYRYPVNIRLVK